MVSRRDRLQRRLLLRYLRLQRWAVARIGPLLGQARRADHAFMIVVAILIGLLGGAGAIGFRALIQLAQGGFFQTWDYSLEAARALPWWQRLLIPAVGGLLVGPIIRWVAPETRGSGVPEVMEAVAFRGGFVRARVIVAKAVAAALTIGSGGSAGREGPIVQIGSAFGSAVGQLLAVNPRRMRTFVACGAAAGIAATFNAPIAGALFAVEVILGEFAVASFSPIVIASVTATVLSRHYLGDTPAFEIPAYELVRATEFLPYTALGVIAGLSSVAFIWMVYRTQDLFDRTPIPIWARPAVGGLVVGAIAMFAPQIYGVGYEGVYQALWNQLPLLALLLLIPAKLIATSATLGSCGSGGIFAPSLFVGAMIGGVVGHVANLAMPGIGSPAAYALVGMGAVVAGTTHGPISAILIIFELTGDYRIIPPLMVACIISVVLAGWLQPQSMYTMKLARRGIDIRKGQDINILKTLTVGEIYDPEPETLRASDPVHVVIDRMVHSGHDQFFVVDRHDELQGSFSLQNLRELLVEPDLPDLIVAADICRSDVPAVTPDDNLDLVMHLFGQHDVAELAVVSRQNPRVLLGSLRQRHVIEAYNKEIFRLDLTGGFHSIATAAGRDRGLAVLAGYQLVEVGVPYGFVGKTLREVNVRARYGVEIILVRKPLDAAENVDRRPGAFPHAGYRFEAGDSLLVLGTKRAIQRFHDAIPAPAEYDHDQPPEEGR